MTDKQKDASSMADREIRLSRVVDAPRELVFNVWTDPEHVAHWWGPNGFSITTYEMEVKPGSQWRFMMHGPDGVDYPNKIVYIEVERPERLVFRHTDDTEAESIHFLTTVVFEDLGDKTRVEMTSLFDTAEARNEVIEKHGAIEGGKQTLGRLAEYAASLRQEGN